MSRPPTHFHNFSFTLRIFGKMKRFPRNRDQSIELIPLLIFRNKTFEIVLSRPKVFLSFFFSVAKTCREWGFSSHVEFLNLFLCYETAGKTSILMIQQLMWSVQDLSEAFITKNVN